jgi:hypothetical protein
MSTSGTITTTRMVHLHVFRLGVQGEGLIGRAHRTGMLDARQQWTGIVGWLQESGGDERDNAEW